MIESLEPRIALATLVNPHTVSYTDFDGDTVLVKTTKGAWTLADFSFFGLGQGEDLLRIDLTNQSEFTGAKISVVASGPGDGRAFVLKIDASGVDLAAISVDGTLGSVQAGDSVLKTPGLGSLTAASLGAFAGAVHQTAIVGKLGKLSIAGDVAAGAAVQADSIGAIVIGGSLKGTALDGSGEIETLSGGIGSVAIGGSVLGGDGESSGSIMSFAKMGAVKIGGNLTGGSGSGSGRISSNDTLGNVTIGGSVRGGAVYFSGQISSQADCGVVKVGADLSGGAGYGSGSIVCDGTLRGVIVGNVVHGGSGEVSGYIQADKLGPVKIGDSVTGGSGVSSGSIFSFASTARVTIGKSLLGGSNYATGQISSLGSLGPIKIGGDLQGGSISGNQSLTGSGYIEGAHIASVTIGGSIKAGSDQSSGALDKNASIRALYTLGPVTVKGGLFGDVSAQGSTPVIISARGQQNVGEHATRDVAIKSLNVGMVSNAFILAGYDTNLVPVNGDAQIGAVTVRGSWTASSLVAGVSNTAAGTADFGTALDTVIAGGKAGIFSRIASITIKGAVTGTDTFWGVDDNFGFVAQQIGSFKAPGVTARFTPAKDAPVELSPATGDVTVREV